MRNVETESRADRIKIAQGRKGRFGSGRGQKGSPKGWVLPYRLLAECALGLTRSDVDELMGEAKAEQFYKWMEYQTIGQCNGRVYDRDASTYRDSHCATAHGAVYYRSDVARFLNGLQPSIERGEQ